MTTPAIVLKSMGEILKPVSNVKITITENLFVKKYLPLAIDPKTREEFVTEWLKICKGLYQPVDVINEYGELLYEVPAIFNKQATRIDTTYNNSYLEVMEMARLKSEIIPANGDRFFLNAMEELNSKIDNDGQNQWKQIFSRYGYIEENLQEEKIDDNDLLDELEYGEF